MALFIEAVGAEGVLQRAPVSGRDLQLTARPGLTYRLVRDADLPPDVNPAIKRYDNDLVLEDLPDGSTVRISGFFSNCTPEQVCALSLEGIGGGTGDVITPAAEPVAALADGGFLLRASSVQQAVLPVAPESEFPYKAALGGLALAGLAAGGGGGGGSDTPVAPAPPAAPVITSAKFTNDLTPVVSGTTTAGATVTVTFELPAQTFVTFETTADSAGHWSIDTGSTAALKPGSPPMPSGGLPANGDTTIQMLATNTAGSTSASDVITTDTTPPDATATIASVTDDQPGITGVLADGDTSNDPSPALAGTISRALVTGETVKVLRDGVVVGDAVVSGTTWTYTDTGVTDGATHVFTAGVYDALGNGSTPANSISLSFDLSAPATPTINVVAGDDIVNEAEGRGASPVVVTGTAEPGATVDLNWDTATLQVTAGTDGSWTASFAAVQVPADGIHALTASSSDAAGNVSTASRTVQVLTGKPSAPAFDAVEGDDLVSQAEAADGITFTGATSSGTTVAVTLNGVTVNAVVSGTTWSATFAPGSLPPDASGLTATAIATDLAGNLSLTGTSNPFTIDRVAPPQTVTITNATDNVSPVTGSVGNGGITNDSTPQLSGTVSAALAGDERVRIYRDDGSGAVAIGDVAIPSGTAWQFTDAGGLGDGTYTYTARVVDGVGNDGALSASFSLTIDSTPPAAPTIDVVEGNDVVSAIEASDGVVISGAGAEAGRTVTVDWGGVVRNTTAAGDGTWSVSYAAGSLPADGNRTVSAIVTDAAGNNSPAATRSTQIDTTAPTVTITDNEPGTATGTVRYTFTFSEPVSGFTGADVSVSAGTPGTLVADSPSSYHLDVVPPAGSTGTIDVSVGVGSFTDAIGNPNVVGASRNGQAYDTQAPTITSITDNQPGTASGDITYTINFSESVIGFDSTDVTVTGGAAVVSVSGSGSTRDVVVRPPSDTTGTVDFSIAAGRYQDLAGNSNTTAASLNGQAFDTAVPPTLTISDNASGTASGAVVFTFTFSEPVQNFTAADVTVVNGTKGSFNGTGAIYTLSVTPPAGSTGNIEVSVAAGVATDLAGNPNLAATNGAPGSPYLQPYDTVAPTIVSITDDQAGTATGNITYSVSFSEAVTGFTAGDVSVTAGTVASVTGSGQNWSVVVTPPADASGTIDLSIGAGAVQDLAGNSNTAGGSSTGQAYDTRTPPTLTISDDTPGTASGDVVFTFAFSENVTGFDAGDIGVTGGSAGTFGGSGSTYTLAVTPTPGTTGNIAVSVAANVAQDATGAQNEAATNGAPGTPYLQAFDTQAPTLTIGDNTGASVTNQPVTFTFNFSESVIGFDASDITVTNGTAGLFNAVSGSSYTLQVTPNAGFEGNLGVSVNPGAAQDAAGNASGGDSHSQVVDTKAPTLTLTIDKVLDDVGGVQGDVLSGQPTDDTGPEFRMTLSGGSLSLSTNFVESVHLFEGPTDLGAATDLGLNVFSLTRTPDLPAVDASYSYTARVVDQAGNLGPVSATFTLVIDVP